MEEKIKFEDVKIKEESLESEIKCEEPKKKKQIALKVIATFFYSLITSVVFIFDILLIIDTVRTITTPVEGWDGLGKALALAIVIICAIISGAVSLVLYQIPCVLSIVGFGTSFSKKKKRGGKIYFSILFVLTVISEIIAALISGGIILAIKLAAG